MVYEDRFDDVFEGFQEASAVEVVEDLTDLDADDGSRRLRGGRPVAFPGSAGGASDHG